MKKNLGTFVGFPCVAVGAIMLALCTFTTASRADVTIVGNTGDTTIGNTAPSLTFAQVFTMGSGGTISSLTLTLGGSGSSHVYIYAASSGAPPTSSYNGSGNALFDLGSVSASSPTLTGLNDSLSAGTYAIVLAANGSAWDITPSSSVVTQNGSSIGGLYYDSFGTWTTSGHDYAQMNLASSVPEVPMTGAIMGVGVLAIAGGRTLRRKLRPLVSSIT